MYYTTLVLVSCHHDSLIHDFNQQSTKNVVEILLLLNTVEFYTKPDRNQIQILGL